MKEWLSNKKNLPIIVAICAVVILGAVAGGLYASGILGGGGGADVASAPVAATPAPMPAPARPAPGAAAPGGPTARLKAHVARKLGVPAPVGKPNAVGQTAKKVQVANALPAGHQDPFAPGYTAQSLVVRYPQPPVSDSVPVVIEASIPSLPLPGGAGGDFPRGSRRLGGPAPGTPLAPTGRVSGVILSNGARAIYEASDGEPTIVQPGSPLPDNSGIVQSIQSDGITVRLANHDTLQIPVTADTSGTGAGYPGAPQSAPPADDAGAAGGDNGDNG